MFLKKAELIPFHLYPILDILVEIRIILEQCTVFVCFLVSLCSEMPARVGGHRGGLLQDQFSQGPLCEGCRGVRYQPGKNIF